MLFIFYSQTTKWWPYPFIVTDEMVRSVILQKLQKEEMLGTRERVVFLEGIYDECSKYTL